MMKRRDFLSGLSAAAGAAVAGAAGVSGAAAQEAKAGAGAEAPWIVGIDPTKPPMIFRGLSVDYDGYDVDLMNEAFKRMNVPVKYKLITWGEKEAALLEKKSIDLIWSSLSITEARRKIFNFSRPYMMDGSAIVVRPGDPIQSKADLAGKTVAVKVGYMDTPKIKAAGINIREYASASHVLAALLGEPDLAAGVCDMCNAKWYAKGTPGSFRILPETFSNSPFGVGFRPEDTAKSSRLDAVLAAMEGDGFFRQLNRKWFGQA